MGPTGPTLYVSEDYEDNGEANDDEHLYCSRCGKEWALPDEISFDPYWPTS